MEPIKFEAWKKKYNADTDSQFSLTCTTIPQIWKAYDELEKLNYLLGRLNLEEKKKMSKGLNKLESLMNEVMKTREFGKYEYAEVVE